MNDIIKKDFYIIFFVMIQSILTKLVSHLHPLHQKKPHFALQTFCGLLFYFVWVWDKGTYSGNWYNDALYKHSIKSHITSVEYKR